MGEERPGDEASASGLWQTGVMSHCLSLLSPLPPLLLLPSLLPYLLSSSQDCDNDTLASTIRNNRVRSYEVQTIYPGCPDPTVAFMEWLWIDSATEEDARHTYTCQGSSNSFNPFPRIVNGEIHLNFTSGWFAKVGMYYSWASELGTLEAASYGLYRMMVVAGYMTLFRH